MRNIPDVAMVGDNVYVDIRRNGSSETVGGTSCAAPLWAGFMALVNQQAAAGGKTNGIGFINPAVYEIANGPFTIPPLMTSRPATIPGPPARMRFMPCQVTTCAPVWEPRREQL